MSRVRRPREAAGVSLFPFLAVLLCTMGALIVLLVVIARQAEAQARDVQFTAATEKARGAEAQRRQAEAAATASAAEAQAKIDEQAAELRAQANAVSRSLETQQQAAARLHAELGAAQRQLGQLQAQQRDLDRLTKERPSDEQLRRQLAELDERLRQAQAILSQRQQDAAATPQEVYSIVPYAGRNGAARRPIYIECRGDRIIIQPEGTELTAADFETLGPGNPLEAAVRVTASAWQQGLADQVNPYPLLLVRPDGVQAYHAAREALSTWGQEFGYELVDQDWKIAFPPADAALAQQQQMAVSLGRQQMQALARNQTRRRRSSPSFRVASNGSLERVGGGNDDGPPGPGGGGRGRVDAFGAPIGRGSGTPGDGTDDEEGLAGSSTQPGVGNNSMPGGAFEQRGAGQSGTTAPNTDPFGAFADTQHPPNFPYGQSGDPFGHGNPPPQPAGQRFGQPGNVYPGTASELSNTGAFRPGGAGSQSSQPRQNNSPFAGIGSQLNRLSGNPQTRGNGTNSSTTSKGPSGPAGQGEAGPTGNASAAQDLAGGPGGPAGPGGAQNGQASPGGSFSPGGSSSQQPGGSGSSAMMDSQTNQQPPDDSSADSSFAMSANVSPIAQQQGANWALPSKPGRASPLRRDVHLLVDASAITVFVDPRSGQTLKIVRLGPDASIALGEMKDAVWTIMKDWGNPPVGFYWRPVLRTQVTARGAPRLKQLETLLQDSGFEIGR